MPRILAVDDDFFFRRSLSRALAEQGHEVAEADDGVEGVERIANGSFDLVITDLEMPRADGFTVIEAARRAGLPIVMLTGAATADCTAALRAGATDFLMKPFHAEELRRAVDLALERPGSTDASIRPQAALIGESESLLRVLEKIEIAARSATPVLLEGEPGSGLEAFGRLLHGLSSRRGEALVVVAARSCDSDALIAAAERAARGTLFLDDVTVLARDAQVVLGKIVARGEVRVVLGAESAIDGLDPDLSLAIREIRLEMPPLRERPEDVPILLRHFLQQSNRRHRNSVQLTDSAIGALQGYRFPGNVGELELMVDRLVRRSEAPGALQSDPPQPVDQVEAELVLHDGGSRKVAFITAAGQSIESLLVGADEFLLVDEDGRSRHIARKSIAVAKADVPPHSGNELPRHACRTKVHLISGQSVSGEVRWVMGATRRSLTDVLNDRTRVIVVHAADSICFVAKSHIAWVEELP